MSLHSKYETGVIWQDFQHGQFIQLFKEIKEAKSNKKDTNLFQHTFAFLVMYANQHFKLEEVYMEKYNYPDKDFHCNEHKKFIKNLKQFRAENIEPSTEGMDNLLKQLDKWIRNHILDNDQKLGQHILTVEKNRTL